MISGQEAGHAVLVAVFFSVGGTVLLCLIFGAVLVSIYRCRIRELKAALEEKEEERRGLSILLGEILRLVKPEWRHEGQSRKLKSGDGTIWVSPGMLNFHKPKVSGGTACHGLPLDSATEAYLRERLLRKETF